MATFNSKAYNGGMPFRCVSEQPTEITATILVPSGTDLAAADTFNFLKVGAGYVPLEVNLVSDDLDEHADTPTLVLDVGVVGHSAVSAGAAVTDYIIDGSTIGQTGGRQRAYNETATGGEEEFADGRLGVSTTNYTITGTAQAASGGATTSDKYITLTVKLAKVHFTAPAPADNLYEAPAGVDNAPSVYA